MMSFTRKWCVIRILEQLRDLRTQLRTDSERKAWRGVWNSTLDLARALGVLDMIPERVLRVS